MLIVIPSKSCTMTIGSRAMTRGTKFKITINGSTLTKTDCFKLLGIEIYQNITWKNQISATAKNILQIIGLIRRLQNYLPTRTIRLLYAPLRGGPFDTWGGLWFLPRDQTFFSTPSLNVQFFSDLIKIQQFFSQR